MKVNRQDLLNKLISVQPGLSKREIVEQSSCFVFTKNRVTTFNDEIACSYRTDLDIKGAVQAEPLLAILSKLGEEDLVFEVKNGQLNWSGARREGGIRMEEEIVSSINNVDIPKKKDWKKITPEFSDGVSLVEKCAGKDESAFSVTCVHIYPDYVEAYDNLQVARYYTKTGITQPILVRANSIKHIHDMDMTHIAESGSWLHFRNPSGLVLSCRRYSKNEVDPGSILDVDSILKCDGEPALLPKGLASAAEKAEIFSSENSDGNLVKVELRPGKLRVTGRGVSGWYRETKDVKYNGRAFTFLVDPKLLVSITNQFNECLVSKTRLKVDNKKFVYVTCLGDPSDT